MKRIDQLLVFVAALGAASTTQAQESALASSAAAGVAASGPSAALAAESLATSPVFDPDAPKLNTEITRNRYPNIPLLSTGSVLLAASYAPAVVAAAISDRRGDDNLYIPVAGPWMALTRGDEEKGGYKALLIADGAIQGLGALAMLSSLVIPEETTKRWHLFGKSEALSVAPRVAWNSVGVGASGRF